MHHGREGHSVWHLRSASQRRLGECRDRSRHRELRGTVDPALVAAHGSPGVSTSPVAVDHGGCRREQRGAPPVVEVGTAASGQSDGLGDHGLSLSAGYEQVEQDRASVVLAHRDELARHPTRRLGHDREPHWLDAQSVRTPRSVGTRPRPIPGWHHRHRCAAGDGTPRAASLSRRLELHDPSRCSENTKVSNCLTSPKPESCTTVRGQCPTPAFRSDPVPAPSSAFGLAD